MTVNQITSSPTETDLEAEIRAAIKRAFPLLPEASIRHQIQFQFKFGHAVIKLDGSTPTSARARADVVLYFEDRPLAVLELKRESESLHSDDGQQGLSYARALNPSPPLVVVTNGSETRYLETHTGNLWIAASKDELAFTSLMDSATTAAKTDLKMAIQTLMGTNPSFWVQAFRQASKSNMEELTGEIEDTDKPFGRNFLIPRRATTEVLNCLMENRKLVLLEGSSLVGKSNVLREICEQTEKADTSATLYIETGTGNSILQSLADALEDHLNWPVTSAEARFWLKKISESDGPELILAIDGLNSDDREIRREIEDLSGTKFGAKLKLVVALDPSVGRRIVSTKGRNPSPIGHRAVRVEVGPLDDEEFMNAVLVLLNKRLAFLRGADYTPEYRLPWVLRNVAAASLSGFEGEDEDVKLALLPMLSTDLIRYARERFCDLPLQRNFARLAQAMIDEVQDPSRHAALASECNRTFAIRRNTLLQSFSTHELDALCEEGYLKEAIHQTADEEICYVRQPALLASELARILKKGILARGNDEPEDTAIWLTTAASSLPLGEMIAAHAILESAGEEEGIRLGVISTLLATKPHAKPIAPGMVLAGSFPKLGYVKFKVIGDTIIEVLSNGRAQRLDLEEPVGQMYVDCTPWHILSNVFGSPVEILADDDELETIQGAILLQIASSEIPLHPSNFLHQRLPMHDLPDGNSIICHSVGMVEQVTQSLFTYLQRDLGASKTWVDLALTRDSTALLARLHIALLEISRVNNPDLSTWASNALSNQVLPALQVKLPGYESHLAELV